jgi:hypothetical protein
MLSAKHLYLGQGEESNFLFKSVLCLFCCSCCRSLSLSLYLSSSPSVCLCACMYLHGLNVNYFFVGESTANQWLWHLFIAVRF